MDRETLVSRVYEVGLLLRRQRKLSFHPLELEEFYKFYFNDDPPYADHGFRDFEALLAQSEEFFFRSTEGNFSCLLKEGYELKHRIRPNSATKPKLVDLTDPLAPARSESSQSTLGGEDGDFALDGSIPEADVQTAPDDQMTEHDKEEGITDEKISNSTVMHEKITAQAVLEESSAEASAERKSPEKKVNTVAIDKNVPSGPPDERPVFYGPEPIDGSGTDSKSLPSPSSLVSPVAVETDSRKEQTVVTRGEEAISRKKNPILEKVPVVEKAPEEPIRQVIQEQQKDSEEQQAMQYEDDDDTSFTVRFRGDELERNREKMATTKRSAEKVASSSYRPEAPPRQEEDRYHYGYNHNEASVRYGRDSGERRRREEFEDYGRGVQQRARQEQHYDYNQDHYNHQRQEVPVRFNEEYQGAGRRPDERNYPEQRQRLQEPSREVVSVRYGRNSGGQYGEDQQEFDQRNHQEQNYQRHHQNRQKYAHPDIPTRFPTDSDGYEEYHQEYHAGRRPDERIRQEHRHHYQGSSGEHHQEGRHQPNLVNQEYYPESPRQEAAVRAPSGSGVSGERQVLRQREDPRVRGVMYQEHFRKENAARNRREASPPDEDEDEDVQGRQLIARNFLETVESYVKHFGGVVKFTELFTVLREREKEILEAFAEEYGQEIICSSMEKAFYLENHEGEYIVSLSKEIAEQAKQQAKVVSGLNSSLRRLNGELYLVDVYTGAYDNCRHFHHFLHESRIDYDSFEKIATSYFDVTEDERRGGFLKISLTADQRAENFVDEWDVDEEEEEENGDVVVEDRRDTNSRSRLNHEIPPPRRGESGGPEGHRQEPGRRTNERDRQEPRHQRESRESPRRQANYEIPPRHGADEARRRPIVPQQAQNAVEYGPEPPPQDPTPMPSVEVFMKATRRILREFQGHVLLPELNQAFQNKIGITFASAFFKVTGTTKYHLIKEMSNGKILSGFSGQGPEDVWFRLRSTSPEQNLPQNAPPAPVILAVPPPISSIHHEKITLKDVTKRVILVLETKKGEAIDDEVSNAYRKMFPGSELERDLFSQVPLVTGVATLVTCSGGKIAARFDDTGHVRYKLKDYVPLRLAPPAAQDRANEPHNRRGANTEAEVVTVESDSEEEQRRRPAPPKRPEAPRQPTALEKELYGPFVAPPLTSLQPREIVERVIDLFEDDVHAMDVERMEELYRGQFGEELKRFLQPLYGNKDNWMRELVKASKDKLEIQMMGRSGWAIKLKGATQQAAQNRRRNVRMARDQRKMNRRITELEAATKRRAERRRRDSSVERVRRSSRSDSRSRSRSISPRRNRRRGDRDDSDERSARRRSRSKSRSNSPKRIRRRRDRDDSDERNARRRSRSKSRSKSRSSSPKRRGFRETPDVERVRRSSRSDSRSRSRSISPKRNRRREDREDSDERDARRRSRSRSRSRSPKRRGFRETPDKGNVGRKSRSRSRSRSPRRRRRGGRDSERRRSNSSSRSRSPKRRGFRKEREDRERRGSTILVSSSDEEQRRRRQQRKEIIDVSDDDEIQFVDHRSML